MARDFRIGVVFPQHELHDARRDCSRTGSDRVQAPRPAATGERCGDEQDDAGAEKDEQRRQVRPLDPRCDERSVLLQGLEEVDHLVPSWLGCATGTGS